MNFENCTDKDLLEIIKISTEKGWRNFYSNDFSNVLDRKNNKKESNSYENEIDNTNLEIMKYSNIVV